MAQCNIAPLEIGAHCNIDQCRIQIFTLDMGFKKEFA
jgi:hypothetical protein